MFGTTVLILVIGLLGLYLIGIALLGRSIRHAKPAEVRADGNTGWAPVVFSDNDDAGSTGGDVGSDSGGDGGGGGE
jgi:hypothetical protein